MHTVCESGFHSGVSALATLVANDDVRVVSIVGGKLGERAASHRSKLEAQFGNRFLAVGEDVCT